MNNNRQFILNVSVNSVVFGLDFNNLNVLLFRHDINHEDILSHNWRLPGSLIKRDEDPENTNDRILKELTGLQNIMKHQLKAFGVINSLSKKTNIPNYSTKNKLITIPYYSLIGLNKVSSHDLRLNKNVRWIPVNKVNSLSIPDGHLAILAYALKTLRNKLKSSPLIFDFLPSKFTLGQLQKIYETVFGIKLDKRNFRKKISTLNYIVSLGEKEVGVSHRPATLYRFRYEQYKKIYIERTNMLPVSTLSNI